MYYPNRWIQSIDTRTAAGRRISRYEYEYDVHGNRTLLREWNATPAWRAAHPAWETDPDEVAEHEVTAYAYDRLDRLTGVTYRHGTAEQRAVAYTYDRLGNRLSEIETKLDGTPVKNRSFACDRHGRLLTVTDHLAPGRSVRYEYNAAGDTLSKTVVQLDGSGGIVPGTETLRMNFGWDAWGRLRRVTRQTAAVGKWSQAKTGDGRRETGAESGQTSAGTAVYALGEEELVAEFCYDHAGRRVRHDSRFVFLGDDAGGPGDPVPADTRLYVYDEMSALAEFTFDPSLPNDPDALLKTRQYLFGNELLAAESVPPSPEPPAPSPVFYHLDSLGSTVNLTTPDGSVAESYLYDAWGNYRELDRNGPDGATFDGDAGYDPATGLWDWIQYLAAIQSAFDPSLEPPAPSLASWNRFTYTGHEFDPETGLYYFKARFYDPELGRFASEDPYLGDALSPPSLHRYLYASVNPLIYTDPMGFAVIRTIPISDLEVIRGGDVPRESFNHSERPKYSEKEIKFWWDYIWQMGGKNPTGQYLAELQKQGIQAVTVIEGDRKEDDRLPALEEFYIGRASARGDIAFGAHMLELAEGFKFGSILDVSMEANVGDELHSVYERGVQNVFRRKLHFPTAADWDQVRDNLKDIKPYQDQYGTIHSPIGDVGVLEGATEFFAGSIVDHLAIAWAVNDPYISRAEQIKSGMIATAELTPYVLGAINRIRRAHRLISTANRLSLSPKGPCVGPYEELKGLEGGQSHHLNQQGAYNDVIPPEKGVSVKVGGNAITDIGSQHYEIHNVMEQFWSQFRRGGPRYGELPTNLEYSEAVRNAARAAGFSESDVRMLVIQAIKERIVHGQLGGMPVPRIPRPLNQVRK